MEVRLWKDGVGGVFLTRTSSGLVKPDFSEGKELGLGGGAGQNGEQKSKNWACGLFSGTCLQWRKKRRAWLNGGLDL